MLTKLTMLSALFLLFAVSPASAQNKKYSVKFEKVSNNCTDAGMALTKAGISVETKGKTITMGVPALPPMRGSVRKGGKFKARTKKSATKTPAVTGRYSAGGSVNGGQIRFLLIAEYFKDGKPLCTQSWNAAGR